MTRKSITYTVSNIDEALTLRIPREEAHPDDLRGRLLLAKHGQQVCTKWVA